MARLNGTESTTARCRRGLVQPVLPALPLPNKTSQRYPCVENENHEKEQRVELHNESEGDTKTELQVVEEQHHSEEEKTILSPTFAGNTSNLKTSASHPEIQDLGNQVPFETFPDTQPQPLLDGILSEADNETATTISPNFTNGTTDRLDTGVLAPEDSSPNLSGIVLDQLREVKDYDGTGTEAETVSGQVKMGNVAQNSIQPSSSGSDAYQACDNTMVTPVSSSFADPAATQNLGNDIYHVPSEAALNGPPSPNTNNTMTNGVVAQVTEQSSFPTLFDHICSMQFSHDLFDCEICVYIPSSPKPAIYRHAHSLILARSERLRSFIYPQRAQSYSYYVVNLCPARKIDAHAFDAALRFLYSDSILAPERLIPSNGISDKVARISAFDYVMSYMVAGLELGLEPVVTRALDLTGRLLDWDLVEGAVKEAYNLRLSSSPPSNPHASAEDLSAAQSLLHYVFDLILLRLDVNKFQLDTLSTPSGLPSRFRHFEPNKTSVNPALANMVFGSMPATSDESPTTKPEMVSQEEATPDTIASVIMLNLDHEDLQSLTLRMKKIYGEVGLHIIRDIVKERERRRLDVFANRSLPNQYRIANSNMWDVIGWREYVSNGMLLRQRVGFTLPNRRHNNNKN